MVFDSSKKVATLADFARSAVKSCRAIGQGEANFVSLTDYVDNLEKSLTTAIKKDKIPSNLETLDAKRDALVRTLKALLQAASLHPDKEVQAAGKSGKTIFDKYGLKIIRASYEEETTYLRSMFADLDAIATEVKAISGLEETIESLKAAQEAFEAEYSAYSKALASSGKSATEIKKELITALNSGLLPYIDAVSLVNDAYKPLKSELETILARL